MLKFFSKCNAFEKDHKNNTPLMIAASSDDHLEMLKLLINETVRLLQPNYINNRSALVFLFCFVVYEGGK